jgi:3-hydroxyanthranilate 3,4-dioxygenase
MRPLTAFNFQRWIDEHRHLLRPPVGNKQVFEDSEFVIMVVGGPNSRKDYHDDPGEEYFHQIEGDMLLRTIQDGKRVDIPIRQGEILLLPAHVPHSPQRYADTIGLVIERRRRPGERDGFLWFCERCDAQLHAEYLPVENIETDLPPVFERFWSSPETRTCRRCGAVMTPPTGAAASAFATTATAD